MGKPVFDTIIELDSEDRNAWTLIDDVAQAVDDVLAGKEYKVSGPVCGPDVEQYTGSESDECVIL
jgi:hypothetical protein